MELLENLCTFGCWPVASLEKSSDSLLNKQSLSVMVLVYKEGTTQDASHSQGYKTSSANSLDLS
jgi:hypothetical protein